MSGDSGRVDSDEGVSLWRSAWRRLRRNVVFLIGAAIIVAFILLATFAPWLAPHDPSARLLIDEVSRQSNPVPEARPGFPLGADDRGRDLLSRLIVGSRQTLMVGVMATLGGLVGGVTLGTLAGAFGGWVDAVVMRVVDVLLSIPSLLMAFSIAAMFARPSQWTLIVAIAIVQVPIFARLLRGTMLAQRHSDHVLAATALGVKKGPIIFRHMLPNAMGPVIAGTLVLATDHRRRGAVLPRPGQPGRPGARMGPDAGRRAGLLQHLPAPGLLSRALHHRRRTGVHPGRRVAARGPRPEVPTVNAMTAQSIPTPASTGHGESLLSVEDLTVTFGTKGRRRSAP